MEKRLYECGHMTVWSMPPTHCVFCKKCRDVFWDYTNGPYMCICDLELEPTVTETEWSCEGFEDDGYVFDEENYKKRVKVFETGRKLAREKLATDKEFRKTIDDINSFQFG